MSEIKRYSSLRAPLGENYLAGRLKQAVSYRRIAGYFRSSILELVGEQLRDIPDVRVICNSDLDPSDVRISKAARDSLLKEKWNDAHPEAEALLRREQYRGLFELLRSGRVQIRVVDREQLFVHGKAGVFTFADGSKATFIGSTNESYSAFAASYEMLWEDSDPGAAAWFDEEFEALWVKSFALPDAILSEIERISKRTETKIEVLAPEQVPASAMAEAPIYRGGEQLQPWQRQFVSLFMQHRKVYGKARLLLADEVGLGKTLSMATSAVVSALLGDGPVLILCPATLTLQWQVELDDHLGVPSAVWVSSKKHWADKHGHVISPTGAAAISRCPCRIGIVSTGLIVHRSDEAEELLRLRFGTVVLDEAHKARSAKKLGVQQPEPNNLLRFMKQIAERTKHLLLGTGTPIQTDVREYWDLISVLNQGAHFVAGPPHASRWLNVDLSHPVITGTNRLPVAADAWEWFRAPLLSPDAPDVDASVRLTVGDIRANLSIPADQWTTSRPLFELDAFDRGNVEALAGTDHFRRNSPHVRHTVLRKRKALEDAGLLEKVAVDIHPNPSRPGRYTGVVFEGLGLLTNHPFEVAYEAAESFVAALSKRSRAGRLLETLILQRICSSFASGIATAQRLLARAELADEDMPELFASDLTALTGEEIDYLRQLIEALTQPGAVDPKLSAVKWFLSQAVTAEEGQPARAWIEYGCIIFSQYYDTAHWITSELAMLFPDEPVALYAGAGKSLLFKGNESNAIERDLIKKMVKARDVRLVIATDAACEGLNLQTLGTLINIDLPWNPSRLEQRLGRIKRFGQARKTVDMLNLVYHDTQDEKVYARLSERMKNRFDIFGGIPDCLDDEWIEDIEEWIKKADTHMQLRGQFDNIFDQRYGKTLSADQDDWATCSQVLSRRDIQDLLSRQWG